MPLGLLNLQWLNHNSQRSYPLTERATKTDTTSTIRLPDSFIVGLYFPVHIGLNVEPDKFFLKSVLISPVGYNITIGYNTGANTPDGNPDAATVNISRTLHTNNLSYALSGLGDFDESVGQIVIGALDEINALPPGQYFFTPAAGEIESDAIRPMIWGVTRLRIRNNTETSEPVYGDVTLVAGTNMRIVLSRSGNNDPEIKFSAISGLNLNTDCVCNSPVVGECITSINGVHTPDGNFTFNQGGCIQVQPVAGGLSFTDTCAQPCCGCEELDALTGQIDRFSDGAVTLQNFVARLGSEVTQMSLVVLGSRLGDSGCSTC